MMVEVVIRRRERMTPVPIGLLGGHESLGMLLKFRANARVLPQILIETRMRRAELRIVDQLGILRKLLSDFRMFSQVTVVEARNRSTTAVSGPSRTTHRAAAARTAAVPLIAALSAHQPSGVLTKLPENAGVIG